MVLVSRSRLYLKRGLSPLPLLTVEIVTQACAQNALVATVAVGKLPTSVKTKTKIISPKLKHFYSKYSHCKEEATFCFNSVDEK